MNILIASSNSIRSNEIKALAEMLNKKHNVTIAAMAVSSPFMAQSFSFSIRPVRAECLIYKEVLKNTRGLTNLSGYEDILAYEFYATPADAISIMLSEIMLNNKPDLVICGISNGVHLGEDIYFSSNIGIAMESSFLNAPAIAVGTEYNPGGHSVESLMPTVKFIERNLDKLANLQLPKNTFLNISIPKVDSYNQLRGVKVTGLERMTLINEYLEKTDPKGQKYYWANNVNKKGSNNPTGAKALYDDKFIVVNPINYDATNYDYLKFYESLEHKYFEEEKGGK